MDKQQNRIFIFVSDPQTEKLFKETIELAGTIVEVQREKQGIKTTFNEFQPDLVIVDEKPGPDGKLEISRNLLLTFPAVPFIYLTHVESVPLLKEILNAGFSDCIILPSDRENINRIIERNLTRFRSRREWLLLEARRSTTNLEKKIGELETLARLGRAIASQLDLEKVFAQVLEAAVDLTGADEGSLMLLEDESGGLFVRAVLGARQKNVAIVHQPVQDSLANGVLASGQPLLINEDMLRKVKTGLLVRSLIYVPLQIRDTRIGVLGVNNTEKQTLMNDRDVKLLSTLAEYMAIAIYNANLFFRINQDQKKIDALLANLHDGVILIDESLRIILVNQAARSLFKLGGKPMKMNNFHELFHNNELIALVDSAVANRATHWAELSIEGDRYLSAQVTPVAGLGFAISVYDNSYLKKLDLKKSDLINTVSHDLRTPITSIIAYVDLLGRVGPLSDAQKEYLVKVQMSVKNISVLVDDLLNLGRIETGLDTRREMIPVNQFIEEITGQLRNMANEKNIQLELNLAKPGPVLYANPIQIKQLIGNLMENAIKYSRDGGNVSIHSESVNGQVILKFIDNGIGIPPEDIKIIFDKFYRGSNVSNETTGTGLGLSIVRSAVESNGGRIKVDSSIGKGSIFTVIFPLLES